MDFYCKELDKSFPTQKAMFVELRQNADRIIAFKKAQIFKSCEKGCAVTAKPLNYLKLGNQTKGITIDDDYYYIAVNSSRILDTHRDVHLDGNWDKTVKDQQGKNYLVADHKLEIDKTIARKEYIEMFTAEIPFSMLGKSYVGNTQALIYKVRKDKIIHQSAKEWLESGDSIEASVRMQYVKIVFALNSEEKDDVIAKKNYDQYIGVIANKDDFENDINYFWAVKQAKNIHESSLVLFGSNDSTGQITAGTKNQPSNDTDKNDNEPSNDTQREFYLSL